MPRAVCLRSLLIAIASIASALAAPEKLTDGIVVPLAGAWLKVEVSADDIVRVAYAKERAFFDRESLIVERRTLPDVRWSLEATEREATITTTRLRVRVDLVTGAVTFLDAAGKPVLAERARSIEFATVQGEKTFHVQQQWVPNADESLYGLGQRQLGVLDLKGYDLDLWQRNTHVVVPFLVSSRGYGILWDNAAFTRFGDLRAFEAIPAECLRDARGQSGGLTMGTFSPAEPERQDNAHATADLTLPAADNRNRNRASTRWVGELVPTTTGDHQLQTYSNGGIKVWIDGRIVIDHWRQNWLTEYDQVKLRLEAGRHYAVKIESGGEQTTTMQLR